MKKWFTLFLAALCLGATGCDEEKDKEIPPPVLVLSSGALIEAPYVGGEFSLEYSIENAESRRPYVDTDCSWIEIRNVDNTSSSVRIAPSDGMVRNGEIVLSYPGAESVRVGVVQQGLTAFAERVSLSIEKITMESAEVVVHNAHGDAWACPMVQSKNYYDQFIAPNPVAWVESYVQQMYKQWSTYCTTNNKMTLFEDFWGITQQDGFTKKFTNLQVDSPYVAIALEIDPYRIYSGEFIIQEFKSAPLPPVESVDLSFSVTLSFNASASRDPYTISYTPSNKTAQYYAEAFIATDLDNNISRYGSLKGYVAEYLSTYFQYAYKYTGDATFRGDVWIDPLPATLKVSVVLCGCDKYGRITSEVIRKDFTIKTTENSSQTL